MSERRTTNLASVVYSSGDPAATVNSIVQAVIGLLAVIAGVLGVFGVARLGTDAFHGTALFVAGIVLIGLLVESAARRSITSGLEAERKLGLTVRQVSSEGVGAELDALLLRSTKWSFRGGSGSWLRQSTLPAMSRITDTVVPMQIHLVDPRDGDLCTAFAQFRATLRHPSDEREEGTDARTIQGEILASIYAAAWYGSDSRVSPTVVLIRGFSPLRYDVGNDGLFVTVADRSKPGLWVAEDTWLYRSFVDELNQADKANPTLVLPT